MAVDDAFHRKGIGTFASRAPHVAGSEPSLYFLLGLIISHLKESVSKLFASERKSRGPAHVN